jgi:hypothetical protein
MNVIIIRRGGLIDEAPRLVKNDKTAEAVYESLVRELSGDDEYTFFDDESMSKANSLLEPMDIYIDWFVDIKVNNYKN